MSYFELPLSKALGTKMKKRIIIVLLCYLLSFYGLFGSITIAIEELKSIVSLHVLLVLIWLSAWGFHITMSVNWIKDIRLGKNIAIAGTLTGLISITFPLFPAEDPVIATPVLLVGALFKLQVVLPSVLLAIYLVIFHSSSERRLKNV